MGRALQTLVPLGRRSVFCVPFFVSLPYPDGAAAWFGAGGEDVWALDGMVFHVFSIAPGMICRGQGDAVGLVDSVVSGMIRCRRSKAVAYVSLSCGGSPLSLRWSSKRAERRSRNDLSGRGAKEPRMFFSVWR